ncbi:MAG: hypothetical protein ACPGVS_10315 [Primorskyibacter sp.]
MTRWLQQLCVCVLVLAIGLLHQGLAVARGQGSAVDQMVLCTGMGTVVVYINADGEPVAPPHFCPDAAVTALATLDFTTSPTQPLSVWQPMTSVVWSAPAGIKRPWRSRARAPPWTV